MIHRRRVNMTQLVHFCTVSFLMLITYCSGDQQCGVGEELDTCPSLCSDSCPTRDKQDMTCRSPDPCPVPACKCRFNYRRAGNGTCIPTTACPPFECIRPNEEYISCPSYCPTDDCSQATPDGSCPLFGIFLMTVQCTPTCRCVKHYWRKNGVCVPYQQCY